MSSTAHPIQAGGDRPAPAAALTAVPATAPALLELEQVLNTFRAVNHTAKDVVSDARLQQLEWVAGELALAIPLGLTETAGDSLAELLAPDAVQAYLLYGRGGFLRTMPIVSTNPTSFDTTERVRIFCLEHFARQARIPFEAPDLPVWGLRPTVSPLLADAIGDHLASVAGQWAESDRPDLIVRGLAMWAVMRDVLPRLGELETMRLDDLEFKRGQWALTLVRQPQGGHRGQEPEPETVILTSDTGQRLVDWMARRAKLPERLEGSTPTHLWLATSPSPEIGLPLHRRGISRWYKKVADAVQIKQDAAGVPENELVPTRWETMRRTLLARKQAQEAA
ncbi:hypothetical protein ACIBCC_29980 [Streptomyces griseus]|uniref:hypothetical protein n=1 Tax=Streptomyces griseus TaxID=1911 RepID=UPI0037B979A1